MFHQFMSNANVPLSDTVIQFALPERSISPFSRHQTVIPSCGRPHNCQHHHSIQSKPQLCSCTTLAIDRMINRIFIPLKEQSNRPRKQLCLFVPTSVRTLPSSSPFCPHLETHWESSTNSPTFWMQSTSGKAEAVTSADGFLEAIEGFCA